MIRRIVLSVVALVVLLVAGLFWLLSQIRCHLELPLHHYPARNRPSDRGRTRSALLR